LRFDLETVRAQIEKETPSRTDQVLSDLSPIMGKIMSTIKTADQNQLKLEAKIASFEKETDNAVGKLNQGLDKVSKIKTAEKKKQDFIDKLEEQARALIEEISAAHNELQPLVKFNEEALKEIKELKEKRKPKTAAAIRAASFAKAATGLLTAARAFAKVAGAPIP
jgi:chromosome segregation ATPase